MWRCLRLLQLGLLPLLQLVASAAAGSSDREAAAPAQRTSSSFRPTALFGDHMVLQASDAQHTSGAQLHGFSGPHEAVSLLVELHGRPPKTIDTSADAAGKWALPVKDQNNGMFDPSPQGPYVMTLRSMGETVIAEDVWFGTVLMCTGQSNMELNMIPIYNSSALIADANTPEIRLFKVPIATSLQALPVGTPIATNWTLASPTTVVQFSAICYLTARELSRRTSCGVRGGRCHFGLIQSCLGSTDVQSWMSVQAREQARTGCWAEGGQRPPAALPPSHSNAPKTNTSGEPSGSATLLFNAMISPLAGYTLGGVLWDQGENNAHYCSIHEYNCLFATMLASWRALWNQTAASLPVTFVQIGGYDGFMSNVNNSQWQPGGVPAIRTAQSDTLPAAMGWWSNNSATRVECPNCAVAASYDLCSPQPGKPQMPGTPGYKCWIHARNKSEVSRRVALQLLSLMPSALSGEEYSGPVVVSATKNPFGHGLSPTATLRLDHAKGLNLSPGQGCEQCCNQSANGPQAVFEVANRKGNWLPALGSMNKDGTVDVVPTGRARTVANDWLAAVRYAMIDEPQCVLYNAASLPALPFQLPVPWERPARGYTDALNL